MADDRGPVREIAWVEVFPWLSLLRAIRVALDIRKLLVAAVGLLLMAAGWWALAGVFSGSNDEWLLDHREQYRAWPWEWSGEGGWLMTLPLRRAAADHGLAENWLTRNPVFEAWETLSRPLRELFRWDLTRTSFAFVLLAALWTVLVWTACGGIITRLAAVELSQDERCGLGAAARHVRARWTSYAWAPLLPVVIALVVGLLWFLPGLVVRYDAGLVVGGIGWGLVLLAGLFLAALAVGLALGWPLMWATVSVEGTDAFDAISRSYSYVFQRPLHYAFYALVATILGVLGWLFVAVFAAAVVHLAAWTVSWGGGSARMRDVMAEVTTETRSHGEEVVKIRTEPWWAVLQANRLAEDASDDPQSGLSSLGRFGVELIGWWIRLVKLVAMGFTYSFFWTTATAVYLLLRYDADSTETDELFVEEGEERYGLPPLVTDDSGVPVVDEVDDEPERAADASTTEARSHGDDNG